MVLGAMAGWLAWLTPWSESSRPSTLRARWRLTQATVAEDAERRLLESPAGPRSQAAPRALPVLN